MQQEHTGLMMYVALVSLNGDIDAMPADSYEAALDLLQQRAQYWGWDLDPQHPLDRATATLEQLSTLYAHNETGNTSWVTIAPLLDPRMIVAPPVSDAQEALDEWVWEEDDSDSLGDEGAWMEEHLDVLRSPSGRRQHTYPRTMTITRAYAEVLFLAWLVIGTMGILLPNIPGIGWGTSLLGQWGLFVAIMGLIEEMYDPVADLELDEWDREEEPCDW
jgi:hypothetical protein